MAGMGIAAAQQQGDTSMGNPVDQPQDQGGGEPQPNVTPEEQQQYNEFVSNGMKLVYRGEGQSVEVNPAVLDQLRGKWDSVKPSLGEIPPDDKPLDPKSPIDNLAVATVALALALEASAASQQKRIDPEILFHGSVELMEQLADIASAAGIHDFTTDELTGAANRAALVYGVSSKTMNKQEALAEFDHFLQTSGDQLGQALQGIGEQEGASEGADSDSDGDTAGDTDQDGDGGAQAEEQAEPSDNPQEEDEEKR